LLASSRQCLARETTGKNAERVLDAVVRERSELPGEFRKLQKEKLEPEKKGKLVKHRRDSSSGIASNSPPTSFDANECQAFMTDQRKISQGEYRRYIIEQAIAGVLDNSSGDSGTAQLIRKVYNNEEDTTDGWNPEFFPDIDEITDKEQEVSNVMFLFAKYACIYEDKTETTNNKELRKEIRRFCRRLDNPPILAPDIPRTMHIFVRGIEEGIFTFSDTRDTPETVLEGMVQDICGEIGDELDALTKGVRTYYEKLGWIERSETTQTIDNGQSVGFDSEEVTSDEPLVTIEESMEQDNNEVTNGQSVGFDSKEVLSDEPLVTIEESMEQDNDEVTNGLSVGFDSIEVLSDEPLVTIEESMEQDNDVVAAGEMNEEGVLYMLLKFNIMALPSYTEDEISNVLSNELKTAVQLELYQIASRTYRHEWDNSAKRQLQDESAMSPQEITTSGSMLENPPELIHLDVDVRPVGKFQHKLDCAPPPHRSNQS
jgi:hypothetical protein